MLLGTDIIGYPVPVTGRIRNLHVYEGGTYQVESSFAHEGATADHHALTYVNGVLSAIDSDGLSTVATVPGNQNVNVIPAIESDPLSAVYFDENDGQRVLLRWAPSADNIDGYKVYQTDLAGLNPVLLYTITKRQVERASLKYPDSGTGAGRISTPGIPVPAAAYGTLTITITDTGEFDWALAAESGSETFTKGATVFLAYGIGIFFYDDLQEYQAGDLFTLAVGPVNQWLSDALDPGEYRFGITAFTGEDESTTVLTQVYEVVTQASAVGTHTATWNGVAKTMTIAFTLPAGAVSVNLYSNFYETEGFLDDYVSLNYQRNHASQFVISFGDVEGTFLYYLRPVTADGVELQDFTLHDVPIPDTLAGAVLSEPINLTGDRVGSQNWEIEWGYFFEPDDALDHFTVHRIAAAGTFTHDASDLVYTSGTISQNIGAEETYNYAETAETETAGALKIQVLAHSAGGVVTYSDVLDITTGAVVIAAPAGVNGGTA